MSSGRHSLLGELEKMSGFYVNFYFKNIEYDDGFYGGEFSSPDSDVYCEFLYDRKAQEFIDIWNNEAYSGGGFEDVEREGRGGGLLGRVLLVQRVVAEASECVSPLRLDGASRMVGRRLACRDAAGSRARHLTREIVT